jgi:hypothetical protein
MDSSCLARVGSRMHLTPLRPRRAGTTSYFVATVTSSVAMTHAYAEEVSVLTGRALDNQDKATAASVGAAWVLPTSAPAGTTPRQVRAIAPSTAMSSAAASAHAQVLWAMGFNEARAGNAESYFIAPPSAATGCAHASGLNTRLGAASSAESELWTKGGELSAADLVASRCQFEHSASAAAVQGWWLQQYRKASPATEAGANTAHVAFQFYWDDRVSSAAGDAAQVRRGTDSLPFDG